MIIFVETQFRCEPMDVRRGDVLQLSYDPADKEVWIDVRLALIIGESPK